jgi:hypothetical protein
MEMDRGWEREKTLSLLALLTGGGKWTRAANVQGREKKCLAD